MLAELGERLHCAQPACRMGVAWVAWILPMVVRGPPAVWGDADGSLLIELRCEQ